MAYTKIQTKDGQSLTFLTQQYEVGLYCIVNNDPSQQFGVDEDEEKFHKNLHKQATKNGDKIESSSYSF